MPSPKRCKLAWYAAGSPKLAFLPLAQLLAHDTVASGELSYKALVMQREQSYVHFATDAHRGCPGRP